MKKRQLSVRVLIKAELIEFLSKFVMAEASSKRIVEKLKNKDKAMFVMKKLIYRVKGLDYVHIVNEINNLQLISKLSNKINSKHVRFPKIIRVTEAPHEISLTTEYVQGETLDNFPNSFKVGVLEACISYLRELTLKLDDETVKTLPKRDIFQLLISFPLYVLKASFKEPNLFPFFMKLAFLFYRYFPYNKVFVSELTITHRDLHAKNIIMSNKSIVIIDPEICVLTDKLVDIAVVTRLYYKELGVLPINTLLNAFLGSDDERNRFLSITAFDIIQTFATEKMGTKIYSDSKYYSRKIFSEIIPNLKIGGIKSRKNVINLPELEKLS